MQFQNICHFKVLSMPTRLKSTQYNECWAVCVNYAKFTFLSSILPIFVPWASYWCNSNRCHFEVLSIPPWLKSTQCNEWWAVWANYAFCAKVTFFQINNTYLRPWASYWFNSNRFVIFSVFHATRLKSTQCSECWAVFINYVFSSKFTFIWQILRIFTPEDPIDGIPKH